MRQCRICKYYDSEIKCSGCEHGDEFEKADWAKDYEAEAYQRGAREFAEYLQKYICIKTCGDTKCINNKMCVWYYNINDALDEWQKEIKNN